MNAVARAYRAALSRRHARAVALSAITASMWLAACDSPAAESAHDRVTNTGSPFPLSKSVTNYCAMKPTLAMCAAFEPLLEEFVSESRDSRWAVPVETLIRKFMLVNGQPWADIRALECRRTMCALEYAVSVDDQSRHVDGDPQLEATMTPVGGVVAPEVVAGQGLMVSVLIWRRRS